jgi:hypothetical protein
MDNPLIKPPENLQSDYFIIACNTPDELSLKVTESLHGGKMFLHGYPFVFKDQICQTVKIVSFG